MSKALFVILLATLAALQTGCSVLAGGAAGAAAGAIVAEEEEEDED